MADNYTPTTEQVRRVYAVDGIGAPSVANGNRFDRWLAARDAARDAEVAEKARADERAVVDAVWELVAEWERVARAGEASEIPQRMSVGFAVYALRRRLITARTPDPNGDTP